MAARAAPPGEWLDRQYRYSATAMLKSVSAVDLQKSRPGFGHVIRAKPGSVVASPVLASYDPDPDYFFHWFRDSAVVIDALRLLFEDGTLGREALTHVADFMRFSRSLEALDGRTLVAAPAWREKVAPDFIQYLRDDASLAAARGEAIVGETRVNPDGTLDISKWGRPQFDGPALRALALMRWMRSATFDAGTRVVASELIRSDLAFAFSHWREPCFDIWEEESGRHYYTLCVSAAALEEGARWLQEQGEHGGAQIYGTEVAEIRRALDGFWLQGAGYYRSRVLASGARSAKELDIALILAAIHAGGSAGAHTVHDPRMHSTLAQLEALFDAAYPINRDRSHSMGPAMGRYAGDVYYSGGAYYFSTLGAAELCFRAAAGSQDAASWIARGDAYLATVRRFTPPGGELSEQFDQRTGAQSSARHLAWSYAAFISCAAARRRVAGR